MWYLHKSHSAFSAFCSVCFVPPTVSSTPVQTQTPVYCGCRCYFIMIVVVLAAVLLTGWHYCYCRDMKWNWTEGTSDNLLVAKAVANSLNLPRCNHILAHSTSHVLKSFVLGKVSWFSVDATVNLPIQSWGCFVSYHFYFKWRTNCPVA